ncbi:MAG: replication initiation protein [Fusobacteriaceae bacterium]
MGKVAIHKKINRLPIEFQNENTINCFVGLLKEFSKGNAGKIMLFTKQEIWEMAYDENNRYRESLFQELLAALTKSYVIKQDTIITAGSIFGVEYDKENDRIEVAVSQIYARYLFTEKEITLMNKAKNKEKMDVEELDYWDTILRDKKQELLLLEEAELRGIRGKYAKRLYMLLKQFKKTGHFIMSIENFKDVMEVPNSYTFGRINELIIKKAQAELTKRGIFDFPKDPKGKGRRKIEKVEIKFFSLEEKLKNNIAYDLETITKIPKNKTENKISILSQEEEKEALGILKNYELPEEHLKTMKKKNPNMYWNTLSQVIKK